VPASADAATEGAAVATDESPDEDLVPRLVAAVWRYLEVVQPVRVASSPAVSPLTLQLTRCNILSPTIWSIQILAAALTVEAAATRCPHAGPLLHRLAGVRPLMV